MPEVRIPDEADDSSVTITPVQLFRVFTNERRQLAVTYLAQKPGAILLGDLAEYIAIKEGEPTMERYERICTDFYHSHLPQMREIGLIEYDEATELVELATDPSVVAPYLKIAGHVVP